MLTATSPYTAAAFPFATPIDGTPFTLGELRELDVPLSLAVTLCDKNRPTQVWALRALQGLPFRPTPAMGLTVRVDKQDNVLSIDRP